MNMIEKAIAAVRDYKKSVEEKINSLADEINKLERQRDKVLMAQRPKSEVVSDIENAIDIIRNRMMKRLEIRVEAWSRHGTNIDARYMNLFHLPKIDPKNGIPYAQDNFDTSSVDAECLVGILGEAMKPSVRKLISNMDWPGEEGLPREEREKTVRELNKRISELNLEIKKIIEEAEDAGISFD